MQSIRQLCVSLSVFFLIYTYGSDAVSQDTPQLLSVEFESCQKGDEICGSGLDENCDGIDASCPGIDKDRDGFPSSQDCDDTNRFVYPGISVGCEAACGSGYKTCQGNGAFSDCTCAPLCESSSGSCYYVDPVSGTPSGSGSFASRMKSLDALLQASVLKGGDVVYLFSGLHGYDEPNTSRNYMIDISGLQATAENMITFKNYPGAMPVFASANPGSGIRVHGSQGLLFEGLVVDGAFHAGFLISESRDIVLRNTIIRRTHIVNSTSASLMIVNSGSVTIDNSILHGDRNLSSIVSHPSRIKSAGSAGVYFIRSAVYP
jgi:hypothetical protein